MGRADRYYPGFDGANKWYPDNFVSPTVPVEGGQVWYVDGDKSTDGSGTTWEDAFSETQFDGSLSALTGVAAGDVFYVAARTIARSATDPVSYTANLVIDVPQVSIIGVSRGLTQGGLPQFKVGATTTSPIIYVQAPGVMIANIGVNGYGGTGGGIKFGVSAGTYDSFGGSVLGCHLKNCVGTTATNAATGGAIMLSGAPWQIRIDANRFYKNVGDIVLLDTNNSVPQDVVIINNFFSDSPASTDCNIYGKGGSGFGTGLIIDSNVFGALPAIGSASNARYMDLTGADGGMLTRNMFGAITAEAETEVTFKADGTAAKLPTTVFMAGNWGQTGATAAAADGASGEVFLSA